MSNSKNKLNAKIKKSIEEVKRLNEQIIAMGEQNKSRAEIRTLSRALAKEEQKQNDLIAKLRALQSKTNDSMIKIPDVTVVA